MTKEAKREISITRVISYVKYGNVLVCDTSCVNARETKLPAFLFTYLGAGLHTGIYAGLHTGIDTGINKCTGRDMLTCHLSNREATLGPGFEPEPTR